MSTLSIIPAQYEHIAPVAIHARQADRDEIASCYGVSPFEGLEFSMSNAAIARTVLIDGRPAAMFGCGDMHLLAKVGKPWMVGTDDLALAPVAFLRASIDWRGQLFERYDKLRNIVDDRNTASIRWLKWLGFGFSKPMPAGVDKVPFRIFEMRRTDVH